MYNSVAYYVLFLQNPLITMSQFLKFLVVVSKMLYCSEVYSEYNHYSYNVEENLCNSQQLNPGPLMYYFNYTKPSEYATKADTMSIDHFLWKN
jgi:hypothetical protein